VNPATSTSPKRWRAATQVILSVAVIYLFGSILFAFARIQLALRHGRELAQNPPPPATAKSSTEGSSSAAEALWPRFPHTGPSNLTRINLNGVEILSEDWDCAATPGGILGYYREQMAARGWRDTTEETYGLQPELREWGVNKKGLQDEKYLEVYRKVMDSSVVLRRGQWSMHVLTQPRKGSMAGTAVKIYAAATPSLKDFFADLAPAGRPALNDTPAPGVEATQYAGKDQYHTTIQTRSTDPEQALQEAEASFRAKGWRPLLTSSPDQSRQAYSTWFAKDTQYAVVMVHPLPNGQGSTVTLTEVTAASHR
jgi:hypothetical protein